MSLYSCSKSNTECSNTEAEKPKRKLMSISYNNKTEFYEGEVDDNSVRDGWGIYKYKNGDVYEGKFRNGVREGKGEYMYTDGSFYRGDWKNDKKHGFGTFKFNRLEYDGLWVEDEFKEGTVFKINEFETNGLFDEEFLSQEKLNADTSFVKKIEDKVLNKKLDFLAENLGEENGNNFKEIKITENDIDEMQDRLKFINNYFKKHDIEIKKIAVAEKPDFFINTLLTPGNKQKTFNNHLPNCLAKESKFKACLCENIRKFLA
jgi:hypothetical protein